MSDKKYPIPFPVLFDTEFALIHHEKDGLRREIVNFKKGYFNYDTNQFEIPAKDWKVITKNPKLLKEKNIIEEVGYRIV